MKYFLITVLFFSLFANLNSQQKVKGVVNSYYQVLSVSATGLQVAATEDLSDLFPGDKILLVQMTGVEVNNSPGFENSAQTFSDFLDAGRFYLLAVKSVNNAAHTVDFTVSIDASTFTNGEKMQLVKIYEADNVIVDSVLTARDWDGTKGGVLAMVVFKKLTLNANIDVSETGFRGASQETGVSIACNTSNIHYYDGAVSGLAGIKGEGIVQNSWTHTKGPGRVATAGGGGIGRFAGGGGGSNYGFGGNGGAQNILCTTNAYSTGGLTLNIGSNFYSINRIILGGGGGSSTQDASHTAIKGGNGGGIVIIITDTLQSNPYQIISNGQSVTGLATAGGAGGGAGGSIFLDINYYKDHLSVISRGGNGGNSVPDSSTGGGGGGGGGIFRYSGLTRSPNISFDSTSGFRGNNSAGNTLLKGTSGSIGGVIGDLQLPINGFLFNTVYGTDTLCQGQTPDLIKGSVPKGGTTYTYAWQKSTDSSAWFTVVGGTQSLTSFLSAPINQTTWFRRIVTSGSVVDTSLPEKVYVYNAITDNLLTIRDTLCSGTSPGLLQGDTVGGGGGNGTYLYQWQSSINHINWTNRVTTSSLNEGNLISSTFYRRIVASKLVCVDTSNIDTITVLPLIGNNVFNRADTAICQNLDAGTIKGSFPNGGDNLYRYSWLNSTDNISYLTIGGAVSMTYTPGNLSTSANYYYKRVVYSGEGDVCSNTSSAYRIQVYPSLTNNSISTDSVRYCEGDDPLIITGLVPLGGDQPNFRYRWSLKTLSGNWTELSTDTLINYNPTVLIDSVYIKRKVISGRFGACQDFSDSIKISVIPAIDNLLTPVDSALCYGSTPLPFVETTAEGGAGNGTYVYQWQFNTISNTVWQAAPDINNLPSYSSDALFVTTNFRRQVGSQICTSFSNELKITVYSLIDNNIIEGGANQFVCYNSPKVLNATIPVGGNILAETPEYVWQESLNNSSWTNAQNTFTNQNYLSIPLQDSVYYLRIVKSGANDQCIDTSDAVLVRINPLPAGTIEINTGDTICKGENINIGVTLTGNSPWKITLSPDSYQDTIHSSPAIISLPVTETSIIQFIDIEDDSTCHAAPEDLTGAYSVVVYEIPVANAGTDDSICGLEYTLNAQPSVGTGLWSGPGITFNNLTDPDTRVTSEAFDEKLLQWTETNWKCVDSDELNISFFEQPVNADAGTDQILDYKFETDMAAVIPLVGTGYWSNSGLSDSTNATVRVTFDEVGKYGFRWTVINGVCSLVSDSVYITIGDLEVFTGFSPNGDGVNDEYILELSKRDNTEFIILDVKGGVIYSETAKDEIRWDGKNQNGKDIQEGTYFYIIKEPGQPDRKGFIELRR